MDNEIPRPRSEAKNKQDLDFFNIADRYYEPSFIRRSEQTPFPNDDEIVAPRMNASHDKQPKLGTSIMAKAARLFFRKHL